MDEGFNCSGSYCDTSFDDQINNIDAVNRLPWVGLDYKSQKVKTLVLGESVYDWSPKDPSSIDRVRAPDSLRKIHKAHAFDFKKNSKFVRNIERAVYFKRRPTDEEKATFWNSVVYHNLVSRVLKTKKHRPEYGDYYSGWKVFDEIISIFDVDQVIVYGLDQIKIKSFLQYCNEHDLSITEDVIVPEKVGRSYPRKIGFTKNGKSIDMLFIRHPSSYFSWKKWAPVIRSQMAIPGGIA